MKSQIIAYLNTIFYNPYMSGQSLEALATQAGERLTDFELARDVVLQYLERHDNDLGIEPFVAGNGLAYCIASGVSVPEGKVQPDVLTLGDDGILHRRRTYDAMWARADFVGLWPEASEAALYRVETVFVPDGVQASALFQEAAANALLASSGYLSGFSSERYYHKTEGADGSTILYGASGSRPILAGPNTQLAYKPYGVNELDDELGVEVRLTGPASLELPPRHLAKITKNGIFLSPDAATKMEIALPENHPDATTKLRMRAGTEPAINDEGFLVRPGRRDDSPTVNNPRIKIPDAVTLATGELQWEDHTAALLKQLPNQLLEINSGRSHIDVIVQARQAIEAALAGQRFEPRAIGCLAVSKRLGDMARARAEGRALTPGYFNLFGR
jgi:hypothetical protein